MQKFLVILACFSAFTFCAFAQDAEFSQFYTAQLYLNPGFTGIRIGPRVQLNYRNQWPNVQNGFVTYNAAYDQYFPSIHSSLGLLLTGDNMGNGFYVTNAAYACYSYSFPINKTHAISFGTKVGFFQHQIDLSHAIFLDQLDPLTFNGNLPPATHEYIPSGSTITRFDMGAGAVYYSNKMFFGIGLHHLTSPNESFTGRDDNAVLPMRFTINLGYEFNHSRYISKTTYFGPNFLYINQGGYQQFTFGAYYGVNQVFAGIGYRHAINNGDATIFTFGIRKDILKIGYSYDATVSPLAKYTGGAHEISLSINYGDSKKNETKRKHSRIKECPFIL